jgi:hypothetical protein
MTDPVALASAIGGPVVALAAIITSEFRSSRDRESGERVALFRQGHERALQLLPKKCDAYDAMLAHVRNGLARMDVPEPSPFPPEPSELTYRDWDWMQVRLAAYGSPEVVAAFEEFARAWWLHTHASGEKAATRDATLMRQFRQQAGAAAEKVRMLARADLAGG